MEIDDEEINDPEEGSKRGGQYICGKLMAKRIAMGVLWLPYGVLAVSVPYYSALKVCETRGGKPRSIGRVVVRRRTSADSNGRQLSPCSTPRRCLWWRHGLQWATHSGRQVRKGKFLKHCRTGCDVCACVDVCEKTVVGAALNGWEEPPGNGGVTKPVEFYFKVSPETPHWVLKRCHNRRSFCRQQEMVRPSRNRQGTTSQFLPVEFYIHH